MNVASPAETGADDGHHTAAAAESGSALLDRVRSGALSDDVLLRLGSVDAAVAHAPSPSPLPPPPPPTANYKPYRPTRLDRLRRRLLGPEVQLAAQISVGLAVTSLLVFLEEARFPGACVASTLFLVAAVQSSPAAHVGSRLGAAASFLGAMWMGGTLAGAVASLARALAMAGGGSSGGGGAAPQLFLAPEPGLTVALSVLAAPVLLLFAAVRMAPAPPALQGTGLSLTLFFGLPLISARGAGSYAAIWQGVLALYVSGLAAVGAALLVTFLVLPSLASEAVEDAVSRALRIAGQSLSRTSARVFSPPETSAVAVAAALERKRSRDASRHGGRAALGGGAKEKDAVVGAAAAAAKTGEAGDEDEDSEDDHDDDDDDDHRIDLDRARLSPDAWVTAAPSVGLVPPSAASATAAATAARSGRSTGRLPSFVEAARRLPPAPVPGSGGAIVMEREPDDVPGFHVWWDLVSAPVDEGAAGVRRQRRRREAALRDRAEHRRLVVERALARARQRQQEHREQRQEQAQKEQQHPAPAPPPPSTSSMQSPFAAAHVAADDLEQQQQQQQDDEDEAWARRAYEEALLRPPAAASPGFFFSAASTAAGQLLDLGAAGPPIAGLRPLLGAARVALGAAALEPAFLRGRSMRRFDPNRWAALIGAVEALVTRASALEAVAEDGGGLNEERAVWLAPMLAAKRRAFAEAAACLAILSEAAKDSRVRVRGEKQQQPPAGAPSGAGAAVCSAEQLFGRSWQKCREELKRGLMLQVETYVRAVREAVAAPASKQKPPLVLYSGYNARIHFFAFVVTEAVLDAMQRVDDAAREALCPVRLAEQEAAASSSSSARGGRLRIRLPAPPPWLPALAGMVVMRPAAAHLVSLVPLVRAYFAPLFSCRGGRGAGRGGGSAVAAAAAAATNSDPSVVAGASGVSGVSSSSSSKTTVVKPPADASCCPSLPTLPPLPREAVAALKFALAGWLALTATLVALATNAHARRLAPVYGFVAVVIATTERVEATASRVVSWLIGSTLGGALGLAIMAPTVLAADALALAVLIAAISFAVSLLGMTAFRTTIVLTLMTLTALVLCQYTDGCRLFVPPPPDPRAGPDAAAALATCVPHGSLEVFVARISAVAAGVLLSQLVTTCVAPWFTADWALITMARALRDGASPFLAREYDRFFDEGRRAAEDADAASAAALADAAGATNGGGEAAADAASAGDQVTATATTAATTANANADAIRALQTTVAAPLVAVQLSLARDAVQWRRGALVVPPAVPLVLRSMLSLLDRLAALEITLQLGAPITGRFKGVAFRSYFVPMEAAWRGVVAASRDVAGATAAHLVAGADRRRFFAEEEEGEEQEGEAAAGGGGSNGRHDHHHHHHHNLGRRHRLCAAREASRAEVLRALDALHAARNRARDAQVAARMAHVRAMIEAPTDRDAFERFVAPDDTLRYLAFVTAWIKALNRLESVARAALRDDDFCYYPPAAAGRLGRAGSVGNGGGGGEQQGPGAAAGGGGGGSGGSGGAATGQRAAWWSILR